MSMRLFGAVVVAAAGLSFADDGAKYMRTVHPDEHTLQMQIAVRTLVPDEGRPGPLIHLVGAMHIGDPSFYDQLQAYLDVHDVVLYEGVGGGREPIAESPEEKPVITTERRLRFLDVMARNAASQTGTMPDSAGALLDAQDEVGRVFVARSLDDGWGRPLMIDAQGGKFEATSLGADGEPGGAGADADITLAQVLATPRQAKPFGPSTGIQRDMARALGLEFQLDGIDYSHPHWRNSDLTVPQIRAAIKGEPLPPKDAAPVPTFDDAAGGDEGDASDVEKAANALFGALSGDSFMAKAMGFLFKMMGSSDQGRAMMKIVLADMLSNADVLLQSQQGAMGDLMKVLTVDRNEQVIRDVQSIIKDEPEVNTVAIFYGAGHFTDLEARLADKCGYHLDSTLWLPSMTIDLNQAGLSLEQVESMRTMISRMIEQQLKQQSGG